jgi:osmoprotectant transport system permease protein
MGMGRRQLFINVEMPLSLPIILGGLRTALVQAIGNTAVAALIGAGGFGVFIFQGLGQAAPDLILLGTLPVIALAVITDRTLQLFIRIITPRGLRISAMEAMT